MNVPTMTIGEEPKRELTELEKLQAENKNLLLDNQELKAHISCLQEELRHVQEDRDRDYMRGRIEGLEFSIRCNGVSGDEVR